MKEGMTIQEIADLLHYSDRTIRRKLEKSRFWVRIADARGRKAARFNKEEALEICRICGRGPIADLLEQSGRMPDESGRMPEYIRISELPALIESLGKAIAPIIESAILAGVSRATTQPKALPEVVPALSDRAELVRFVRQTSRDWKVPHWLLFTNLYREYRDRYRVDLVTRAKHNRRTPMAEAEAGGHCARLLTLAKSYWDKKEFLSGLKDLMTTK